VGAGSNETKDTKDTNDVSAGSDATTGVPTPVSTDDETAPGTELARVQVTSINARSCSSIVRVCVCVCLCVCVLSRIYLSIGLHPTDSEVHPYQGHCGQQNRNRGGSEEDRTIRSGSTANDTKDEEDTNDVGAGSEEATGVPTPTATDKETAPGTEQASGQVTSTNARICSNIVRMCGCVDVCACVYVSYVCYLSIGLHPTDSEVHPYQGQCGQQNRNRGGSEEDRTIRSGSTARSDSTARSGCRKQ
jgi:hypothetical protein